MEKEFRELLNKASDAIGKFEHKVEDITDDLTDDAALLWNDMRTNLDNIKEKLKQAEKSVEDTADEALLQAHLGAIEASDRLKEMSQSLEEFSHKVATKAQSELDTVALRAHLAKMEAEDFWEERGEQLITDFKQSADKVKKLSMEAATEIKSFLDKVTKEFNNRT